MASKTYDRLYEQLCQHTRETALLAATESALGWDERTMMPPQAAEYRAEQMTLLAESSTSVARTSGLARGSVS